MCWIYARISEDPREQRRGVERQLRDLRTYAQQQGWEVRGEFHDNDLSAFKEEDRPGYNDLMHAMTMEMPQVRGEGRRGVILALHSSRVWRRAVQRAQAIDDLQQAKACVAFETGGFFDMTKATDRSMLRQLGEADTQESEVKAERVAREALARAEEGRTNGAVLYGWRRVYDLDDRGRRVGFHDVEHEEQAPIVREVVNRLARMETLRSITEDLNRREVPPPGAHLVMRKKRRAQGNEDGSRWNKTSVKKLALRPANAGIRMHHGTPYPAAWPALVDKDVWQRVKDMLENPKLGIPRNPEEDKAARSLDGHRKHMLSWGIGECGPCGSVLKVTKKGKARSSLYVCDGKGCTGRSEEYVDAWVGAVVVARLTRPDAVEVFGGDDSAAQDALGQAERLRKRLEEAAEEYADGILTRPQLSRITVRLKERIAAFEEEAKRLRPRLPLDTMGELLGVPLEVAEAAWEALTVVQKRKVLEVLNIKVRILPTGRRGPGFDPDFVQVLAQDGTPFAEYAPAA
ncbi:recombinase family protein [Streptomyces griseoaurantiacus]|uniref:Recombinase family protein n=1 Tax=Streptomyces griseoaurantiacus TaxID=68213 RepID=A0A7W2DT84_9ACTN|nr:recombinase family protein [Streptomyces griseoaurantiacus]MBA5222242.1 recombinase family protein [Streptomyces griseoaurantiacus]